MRETGVGEVDEPDSTGRERRVVGGSSAVSARAPMRMAAAVAAFMGAALYWPLLRRNALFYSLAGHDATTGESVAWYSVYLACALLVVVGSRALATRRARPAGPRVAAPLLAVFCAQAALKIIEVLASLGSALGFVVSLVDTTLYAVVFVLLTYLWAAWYVSMRSRTAALVALGSFIVSLATRMVMFLPDPAGLVVNACLPLVSLVCWLAAARGMAVPLTSGDAPDSVSFRRPLPVRLIAVLAICLVLGGVVRGFVSGYVNGAPLAPAMSTQDALSVAFAALLFAYTFFRSSSRAALQGIWPAATIVFFAGLLLLSGTGWGPNDLGSQVVIIGRTCLDLLLWIVLVDVARDGRMSIVGAFGAVFVVVDAVSSLLGYVMVPLVLNALGIEPAGLVPVLSSGVAFTLIVASVLFFGHSFGAEELGEGDAPVHLSGEAGTAEVAGVAGEAAERGGSEGAHGLGRFGLSERELAVAGLLADGNSQRKIAELLSISMGTVQSHVKSIYRKLDIHSRQELIDMTRGR